MHFFVVVVLLTLTNLGAQEVTPALPASLQCELSLLTPLTFTFRHHFDIEHREAGGVLVRPNEMIPDLPSGKYLYMILDDGSLYYQPAYDVGGYLLNGRGVWTHAAFAHSYWRDHGRTLVGHVLASGEFDYAFGSVSMYNNRSGKWKGGHERVDFARRILSDRGLTFNTDSVPVRIGLDKNSELLRGHNPEARVFDQWYLDILADVWTHPHGRRILGLYERLGRVAARYTDSGTAETENLVRLFRNPTVLGSRRGQLYTFLFPIITTRTADGMHFAIFRIWDNITLGQNTPDNYLNHLGPHYVGNLITYLSDRLTLEDRLELTMIRNGFAELPEWIPPTTPPVGPLIKAGPVVLPDTGARPKP